MNNIAVDSHGSTIFSEINNDEVYLETLTIEALPIIPLRIRLDLLSFNFLLFGIKENQLRKSINFSRTTEKFWETFRRIPKFNSTFNYYSNKELANTFKYIFYLPINTKFLPSLVIKVFFTLKENNLFTNDISLADVSKTLMFYLKKNHSTLNSMSKSKKPSKLNSNVTNLIQKINIKDLYIKIKSIEENLVLNLLEHPAPDQKQNLDRTSSNIVLQSTVLTKVNMSESIARDDNNTIMADTTNKNNIQLETHKMGTRAKNQGIIGKFSKQIKVKERKVQLISSKISSNLSLLSLKNKNIPGNIENIINLKDFKVENLESIVEMIQITKKSIENVINNPVSNSDINILPITKIVFYSTELDTFKDDLLNQIIIFFKRQKKVNVNLKEEHVNFLFSLKDKLNLTSSNTNNDKFSELGNRVLNKKYTYKDYVSSIKQSKILS